MRAIWMLWQCPCQALFSHWFIWPGRGVFWLHWACSSRCCPSMESDYSTLMGLGNSKQNTIYQRSWSIWKQCVNYKQQDLNAICSTHNDVILVLNLPTTHLHVSVFCSVSYFLCFRHSNNTSFHLQTSQDGHCCLPK